MPSLPIALHGCRESTFVPECPESRNCPRWGRRWGGLHRLNGDCRVRVNKDALSCPQPLPAGARSSRSIWHDILPLLGFSPSRLLESRYPRPPLRVFPSHRVALFLAFSPSCRSLLFFEAIGAPHLLTPPRVAADTGDTLWCQQPGMALKLQAGSWLGLHFLKTNMSS